MNNFLLGYWLGSSDNEGSSGNNNSGCGCGCLVIGAIILYVIYQFVAKMFGLSDVELFKNIIGFLGMFFYPSAWDFYHDIAVGSMGWKSLISLGNILISGLGGSVLIVGLESVLGKDFIDSFIGKFFFSFMMINVVISIIRFFYYLFQFLF